MRWEKAEKEQWTMSKFLVTYQGGSMPANPEQMAQIKTAFETWVKEAGRAVLDPGAPVRAVATVSQSTTPATADIGGYSIIEAQSADEAKRILQSHPFVARGGTLQVNELMVV
jgi:hypothetical protein